MKTPAKGPLIIILFLFFIPAVADLILAGVLPKNGAEPFSMFSILTAGYINSIPWYVDYLLATFAITYSIVWYIRWKRLKKQQ